MPRTLRHAAVALGVIALVACAGTPTRESTGEFVDDSVITNNVKNALLFEPHVHSLDIRVHTFKGAVQLSGFARDQDEKQRAADVASHVAGVKVVMNDIVTRTGAAEAAR